MGPPQTTPPRENAQHKAEADLASRKNVMWQFARDIGHNGERQKTPSWTGFNINTRNNVNSPQDVVGYLPTINASATKMTTVKEILRRSDEIRKTLDLSATVVVMDQALFAKAAEVAWKEHDRYGSIILRLGTFHTICNLLSIIGKRFQDAGLRDLCAEAGIMDEGSVSSVLEGKMYNRAVRVHKCVYEALNRLVWHQFEPWVTSNHPTTS